MSYGTCKTVKVVTDNKDGYKVINESDLTDDDKIYQPTEKKQTAVKKKQAEVKADK